MYHLSMGGVGDSLADPVRRRRAAWAALAALSWIALLLRWGIDSGGVLDTDAMNLGLAAQRFDVIDHQPHPPGYAGYVLLLKLIHLVAPALDAVSVAKWGTRLCGLLTVPAAYWACRQLLVDSEPDALGRPLAAAALAAVHPLLWFHGADGQSHAAEALVTLVLFGVAFRVRRCPTAARLMLVVAVFGLAGSLRPTIPLLSSPLLVWLLWGRPLRDWALAVIVGAASVAVWAAPMIAMSGGWSLYQRASRALVADIFIATHSLFGSRAQPVLVLANVVDTIWWGAVALIPALAWSRAGGRARPWAGAWLAVVALNLAFYAAVYAGEAGYLAAVAGLSCLVAATWPARGDGQLKIRIAAVAIGAPAFLLFGPAQLPVPNGLTARMPTLGEAVEAQQVQAIYVAGVCGAAAGRPAVALTDNPTTTHSRLVPLTCPQVALALYVRSMSFDPGRVLDVWLIFLRDGLMAVPTGVPLEPGPPRAVRLPDPVERILLAPDATAPFRQFVARQSTCGVQAHVDPRSGLEVAYIPARCLPALRTATHSIDFTAPARPTEDRFGGL